jgi:hypothetical protein
MADLISMMSAAAGLGGGEYEIERSLRFNSADSAFLNRTPASASNRKTWTWSGWVKLSNVAADKCLMEAGVSGLDTYSLFWIQSTGVLRFTQDEGSGGTILIASSAVYRDPSAWYHFVLAMDTTQATSTNRLKMYVNGVQLTSFSSTTYPTLNTDTYINSTFQHRIGNRVRSSGMEFNGYMTEIHFIDGQALDPTSFGEFNSDTGVWQPIEYTGTYGTNGFYLNFSDNASTTTLGDDFSGNGNDWTTNNFSVTAGAGNDSLVDSPTRYGTDTGAGGEVRGNYCTLNPLSTTAGTYSQGNLRYVGPSSTRRSNGTIAVSTGKWYWEVTLGNAPETPRSSTTNYNSFGFGLSTTFASTVGASTQTDAVILGDSGYYKNFSGSWTDGGTAFSSGDTLAIAVDLDANTFTFYRNNTQITTGTIGGTAGRELVPIIMSYDGTYGVMDCNFGQRPFAYTAPSGFKALVTTNLPTPTIEDGGEYFNTVLYTGNSSGASVTGVGFQPDLVWMKCRSTARNHELLDVVRGGSSTLFSNLTNAQSTDQRISSFNADGFTYTTNSNSANTGDTFVAWNWKANGAGVSNTAGTISSTVSANTDSGFSIVNWTGSTSTSAQTVGHGLGVAPHMVILKNRDVTDAWFVFFSGITSTSQNLYLNTTAAVTTQGAALWGAGMTSSVVGVRPGSIATATSNNIIMYCFAPVAGYSAFGSYTGNGSADGPFVYTGFRPRWLLTKRTDSSSSGDWNLVDTARGTYNVVGPYVYANQSTAEGNAAIYDILSNGFKIRESGAGTNANGSSYIYAAFSEVAFNYALGR